MSQTAKADVPLVVAPGRTPRQSSSFYRPELDVLRFFAFLGVFQFHAYAYKKVVEGGPHWAAVANSINYAGAFGVDLFFVLSAYLITELLLREKRQFGKLNIKAFYLRRMLRIWPLYFFYLFAAGLGLIPLVSRIEQALTWRYFAAFLLLAGNWSIVAWGWPALNGVMGHLWTVSIEEQFYLLWPPIVRKMSATGLAYVAIAMLILASVTRAVMVAVHGNPWSVWCNTLCRLDPIALGILVAVALRGRMPEFGVWMRVAMVVGGIAAVVFVANFWNLPAPQSQEWLPNLFGFPMVAAGSTLILLATLGISATLPGWLIYLGRISYGLYIYHLLALSFTRSFIIRGHIKHFRRLFLSQNLALAITILLAVVSYELLEKPFLRLKRRFELVSSRPV